VRLYNTDHQPAVVDHAQPAVQSGESHEFTDEQIHAGLAGSWSEEDPRKGLEQEQRFKSRRDLKAAGAMEVPAAAPTEDDPDAGGPDDESA
jgi:hypothetical protein